ncbi:O-antigen ligase family protein [Gracilibacillus marinus]|uniref:O-antigen ligase family protein n=1 Tax=Gracilibacillus marinus TaxID=630535 RepID=A0ABV8VS79_9BACI
MFEKRYEKEKITRYIEIFFIAFIGIQPILDFVSYFGNSFSLLVRVFAMGVGLIYLLVNNKVQNNFVKLIYIILLSLFIVANTINNYLVKDPYSLMQEVTYGIKTIYVIEMLLIYSTVFISIKSKIKWGNVVEKLIVLNIFVINLIMLLAEWTSTGNSSYDYPGKEGHSGWFFSANDLSALLALSFGILLLHLINSKKVAYKLLLFFLVPITIWSLLTVGTKVGLGAIIIGIAITLFVVLIRLIKKEKEWLNLCFLLLISIFAMIYVPQSAVGNNLGLDSLFSDDDKKVEEVKPNEEGNQEPTQEEIDENQFDIKEQVMTNKVLSGRDQFLDNAIQDWKEAPLSQWILGMGPGGNYPEKLKLIEMDFLDLFFGYGILGSILLFAPFLIMGIIIVYSLFKNKFKKFDARVFISAIQLGMGVGIAAFAGHIFLNPSSGIYFAVIFSYLYTIVATSSKNCNE